MDEEISFHEDGEDVPLWLWILVELGALIIASLVLVLILGGVE